MELHLNYPTPVLIDDSDYELISRYTWRVRRNSRTNWYVHAWNGQSGAKRRSVLLHRLIMGEPEGTVDHINRNGLDNRRCNLRIATHSQNIMNQVGRSKSGKGYKGVYLLLGHTRYLAKITIPHRKQISLGYFTTAEEAARAYDYACRKLRGEFAVLNFPDTPANHY